MKNPFSKIISRQIDSQNWALKAAGMVSTAIVLAGLAASGAVTPAGSGGNPVLDPTAMDTSVNPCQDFYQYSCGNWLKRTTIPSDQSTWARSFSVVYEQNLETLKTVLTDYAKRNYSLATPYDQKLGEYYGSCMDVAGVEKQTPEAIRTQLSQIDHLKSKSQLPRYLAKLHLEGINVLFSFGASPDLKNPTINIGEVDQGGMGLPDSTYYTKTDAASVKLRQEYQAHIAKMFELIGETKAKAELAAKDVFAIENQLASVALPPEDLQDPTKIYNPGDVLALQAQAPGLDWSGYFNALGVKVPAVIDVTEPKFMQKMNFVIQSTDLGKLRTYLKWHVLESMAPLLGDKIYSEYFSFAGVILNGQKAPSPRWKRCVNAVSGGMSEALGQAFVAKTFSPQAKQRAISMIASLKQAFENDLSTVVWLDAPTRAAALAKLDMVTQKIGYPDKWRNYDALQVRRDSYWRNALAARIFENRRNLNKIGGPVDPAEWGMSPQTVNAYYDPTLNQINFPAGILQPPFFSEQADDASNFGAIGMVIGHEMTHGFDTTGSKFDGHGMEKDWWTPGVKSLFQQKAQCLIDQYSQYSPVSGVKVNGKLTITENIADSGGLKLAYAALKLATAGKSPEPAIAGLNEDQRFYVSMAQMWCEKQTDEAARAQVSGDPHSPAKFRVIGTIVNSPNFAAAFGCSAGAPMAPVNRCAIW